MQAPHTYTREDVVEINCHSGYGVLSRLLSLVLDQGARLAQPGEFTLRAFLSGRIDLTQAEAVLEVIRARTDASLQVAAGHLQGSLGRSLVQIREALLDLLARVEAALDFPEEAEELSPETLEEGLAAQTAHLSRLTATYREGRLLREGLLTVIAGRPNAGKSSLLNRLLDLDRAIVTEIPGTTRDLIEEVITLGGIMVRLSDTAGLRPARDRLEELGIQAHSRAPGPGRSGPLSPGRQRPPEPGGPGGPGGTSRTPGPGSDQQGGFAPGAPGNRLTRGHFLAAGVHLRPHRPGD